ncbi:MAG: cytochrome c peroxidase [Pyrinomonadaceae bacterium]
MRKLKLTITGVFFLISGLIFAPDPYATVAEGQTSGTGLSSPSGVSASNGDYTTKIGITWEPVRGATSYRIFRNTTDDAAGAIDVGTTAAPYFFDPTATPDTPFFYFVRAEDGSNLSDLSDGVQGLRAVGVPNGPVPPLEPPPAPAGNPVTATKVALGKVLFWDEQLSSTRTVSCGTCHINGASGSDPRSVIGDLASTHPGVDGVFGTGDDVSGSPGVPLSNSSGIYQWSVPKGVQVQVTPRRSMPVINSAYSPLLFWDGRASGTFLDPITNATVLATGAALESQAAGPPVSDVEMAHTGRDWSAIALQIQDAKPLALSPEVPAPLQTWIGGRTYPELFEEAFGTAEVTPSRIAMAIATYERSLFSDRTPFDLFVSGNNQLTQAELRGRQVWNTTTCNLCHGGPTQTNNAFIYTGVRPQNDDLGRFGVTGLNPDRGSMKVPSLRNVELRAPYMRNGRFATLEEVVAFYNRGGDFNAPNKAPAMQPLNLTAQQMSDLAAFMKRPLTDPRVTAETGPFSRPTLYTESDRVPVVSGTGRAGAGGVVPQVTAIEPPLAGNPSFTVAVSNSLPGAAATLVINSSDPGIGSSIPATGSFARATTTLINSGTGVGYGSISVAIPNNPAVVGQTFFGRWYIVDGAAANGFSVSQVFQFTVFGEAVSAHSKTLFDYDGDGRSDLSVRRPSNNVWYLQRGTAGYTAQEFGVAGDKMVPADYDGDGKTDVAVFRPSNGTWYVFMSQSQTFQTFGWGVDGDMPIPTDRDNDGKADLVIYRESNNTWYTRFANATFNQFQFGVAGDKPMQGDFDGDGVGDVALFRPSDNNWYLLKSSLGFFVQTWGQAGDIPLTGDFDGDGATDQAVFRPSTGQWFLSQTTAGFSSQTWGLATDIPVAADYDGDGRTDVAVFRPSNGTWYIVNSTTGILVLPFGQDGDVPTQAAYIN